jgi:hypothetical protein
MKLNEISRQTIVLNNENAELQNQLDSLKSFDNVDKTLQQNNMLQRAGQVIETQAIEVEPGENMPKDSKRNIRTIPSPSSTLSAPAWLRA